MRPTHSYAMYVGKAHIDITSVSTQSYPTGLRLTRNYATRVRLIHSYATGVRLAHIYIKCEVHSSHLKCHCEAHSKLR